MTRTLGINVCVKLYSKMYQTEGLTGLILRHHYNGGGRYSLTTEDSCPILCLHGHVVHRRLAGDVGQLQRQSTDILTAC